MERGGPPSNEGAPERAEFFDVTEHLQSQETQNTIGEYETHLRLNRSGDVERAEYELALQDNIFGWFKLPRHAEIKGSGIRFSSLNPDGAAYEAVRDVEIKDARIEAIDFLQFPETISYKGTLEVWSNTHQAYFYFYLDQIDNLALAINSLNGESILRSLDVLHESIKEKVMTVDFLSKNSDRQQRTLQDMVKARNRRLQPFIEKNIELHANADRFYTVYDDMPVLDLALQNNYTGTEFTSYNMSASGIFMGCELADCLQWPGQMETGLSNGRSFQFDNGAPCIILRYEDADNKNLNCTHYVPINQIKSLD
jgi:hypothetical protein